MNSLQLLIAFASLAIALQVLSTTSNQVLVALLARDWHRLLSSKGFGFRRRLGGDPLAAGGGCVLFGGRTDWDPLKPSQYILLLRSFRHDMLQRKEFFAWDVIKLGTLRIFSL